MDNAHDKKLSELHALHAMNPSGFPPGGEIPPEWFKFMELHNARNDMGVQDPFPIMEQINPFYLQQGEAQNDKYRSRNPKGKERNKEVQKRYRDRCRQKSTKIEQDLAQMKEELEALRRERFELEAECAALSMIQEYKDDIISSIPSFAPIETRQNNNDNNNESTTLVSAVRDAIQSVWERWIFPTEDLLRSILSKSGVYSLIEHCNASFPSRIAPLVNSWNEGGPSERERIERKLSLIFHIRFQSMRILLEINPALIAKVLSSRVDFASPSGQAARNIIMKYLTTPPTALTPRQRTKLNSLWEVYQRKSDEAKVLLQCGLDILEEYRKNEIKHAENCDSMSADGPSTEKNGQSTESCHYSSHNNNNNTYEPKSMASLAQKNLSIEEAANLMQEYQEKENQLKIGLVLSTFHVLTPIQHAHISIACHPIKLDIVGLYKSVFLVLPTETLSIEDAGHILEK